VTGRRREGRRKREEVFAYEEKKSAPMQGCKTATHIQVISDSTNVAKYKICSLFGFL